MFTSFVVTLSGEFWYFLGKYLVHFSSVPGDTSFQMWRSKNSYYFSNQKHFSGLAKGGRKEGMNMNDSLSVHFENASASFAGSLHLVAGFRRVVGGCEKVDISIDVKNAVLPLL